MLLARVAHKRAPLRLPLFQPDPESAGRLQLELLLIKHDRIDGFFRRLQDKFLQEMSYQQLRLHQSESIADALPGAQSERRIGVRMKTVFVLVAESFRIEL